MRYRTEIVESFPTAMQLFDERGWTDGLPVVPPTTEAVEAMLAATDRDPETVLGGVEERALELSVWQAATYAVMAGCRPDYFPVVLATWDAAFDPRFNLHAALSSTGGAALLAIVSGPHARAIGMNATHNLFGPGNRANATIGRAFRLGAMIGLRARPGELDASSFGHAGKYTMHVAEDDPVPPWPSIRRQLGFPEEATTVTILPAEAPRQIAQLINPDPEGLLRTVAACMGNPSQQAAGKGTWWVVLLGPEHALMLREAGWTPSEVRRYLARESRLSLDELERAGVLLHRTGGSYDMVPAEDGTLPVVPSPGHVLVATAGGAGAGWSAAVPSWTGHFNTHPVTRAVHVPGEPRWAADPATATDDLDWV